MLKNKIRQMAVVVLVLLVMIFQQLSTVTAVVPSKVNYRVFLNGTKIFLHNDKPLKYEKGAEYYFNYTVESVTQSCKQHGLVLTADPDRNFPYTDGGFMRYQESKADMLTPGATYFVKMTVASGGFRYEVTRAIDNNFDKIIFEKKTGDATDKATYAGIWFYSSNAVAILKDVRFYDKNGNDLGVDYHCGSGSVDVLDQSLRLKKATDIDHRYDIRLENRYNIAISNARKPTSPTVYIQYKVDSAEYNLVQCGISLSNQPEKEYPHGEGVIKYFSYAEALNEVDLLEVGAEYIIKTERKEDSYSVLIQKTKNSETDVFIIPKQTGEYSSDFDYISLWFGTGDKNRVTSCHLTDFLIYDENKNNLAVQCNGAATIEHSGEFEDYAGCEGLYYCKENDGFISLNGDKTMTLTNGEASLKATYSVSDNVMVARFAGESRKYSYLFKRITDADGNVYKRLGTYTVSFVTGSDTEIPKQTLSNKTGYAVLKPEDPKLEGIEFEGWVTSDDEMFDFDSIVMESTTLYAKWSDNKAIFASTNGSFNRYSIINVISIIGSALILLTAIIVFVLLVRKGFGKNGSGKK